MGVFGDTANTLRGRIKALVEDVRLVPVVYDNEPEPDPAGDVWMRASVAFDDALPGEMAGDTAGDRQCEILGDVIVDVHGALRKGDSAVYAEVDAVTAALGGLTVSGIRLRTPEVVARGRDTALESTWAAAVRIPFSALVQATSGAPGSPAALTGYSPIANACRARFKLLVADVTSVATAYDNAPFSTPADGSSWVRWTVLVGSAAEVSVANVRVPGLARAGIFQQLGGGDSAALSLADTIADAFRWTSEAGVTFSTPAVRSIGRSGDRWQVNVSCPFLADLST